MHVVGVRDRRVAVRSAAVPIACRDELGEALREPSGTGVEPDDGAGFGPHVEPLDPGPALRGRDPDDPAGDLRGQRAAARDMRDAGPIAQQHRRGDRQVHGHVLPVGHRAAREPLVREIGHDLGERPGLARHALDHRGRLPERRVHPDALRHRQEQRDPGHEGGHGADGDAPVLRRTREMLDGALPVQLVRDLLHPVVQAPEPDSGEGLRVAAEDLVRPAAQLGIEVREALHDDWHGVRRQIPVAQQCQRVRQVRP